MYFSLCIEHTSVRILVYHIFVEFFERRDTTRRFNVRRLLAFDACLASIHLLQFPRRFHPPIHLRNTHEFSERTKKNAHLFQISSTFGQLFMRFAFISSAIRSASPRSWCLPVMCFIYLCLWLFKQFIILMHTQSPAVD